MRGLVMRGWRGLASFVIRAPRAAAERNLDLLRRCQLTLTFGCVVEAGGRRHQGHERTEDHAELLDFVGGMTPNTTVTSSATIMSSATRTISSCTVW